MFSLMGLLWAAAWPLCCWRMSCAWHCAWLFMVSTQLQVEAPPSDWQ